MKNYQFYAGIDVSKLTLDITLVNNQAQTIDYQKIENNEKGITLWLKSIKKQGVSLNELIVCFENTGIYSMLLYLILSDKKIDFSEVPALEIQRSKGIKRGKSDKNDSKDIALYCLRNQDKIVLSEAPSIHILELKMLFAEREKVIRSLKSFGMTKENEDYVWQAAFQSVKSINKNIIKDLDKSLKRIEQRIAEIFKEDKELSQQKELLKSVPGIGEITAVYLIMVTKGFTGFKNWRKFACYSGIAPFEHSSGTSINGKTRVHQFADRKSKSMLYMSALSAIRYDGQIKEYYNKKKKEGKHSMLVINNVKNKIVSRAFAVIKRGTPFVDTHKFTA